MLIPCGLDRFASPSQIQDFDPAYLAFLAGSGQVRDPPTGWYLTVGTEHYFLLAVVNFLHEVFAPAIGDHLVASKARDCTVLATSAFQLVKLP